MTDILVPTWPLRPYAAAPPPPGWRPTRRLTLLMPFHRETAATLARSARAVAALDYPAELLQVLWLVADGPEHAREAEQAEHARAAAGRPELDWRVLRLPGMRPKGAALNHAFPHAEGEIVAVVDADVVPDPGQPAEAVWALEHGHALVQAEEVGEPGQRLTSRVKTAEDTVWHASVRGLARAAGVHVVAGSSVYAWSATWDRVRPIRSDDVEESYHWSLRLMSEGASTGFLRRPSRVSSTDRPAAALRQRARWARGQLRAVVVSWPELSPRGRLLGAVTVGSMAARAAMPALLAAAVVSPRARKAAAAVVVADAACVLGARRSPEYRDRADGLAWALVVPWHLVGALAVYRAVWEWARGDRGWHSVRETADTGPDTAPDREGTSR
ncbi:glycosyltransferase [Streptomyces katrae]|uniref:Glycosyl transferase family 2 n=1 Tax=Streptomyces katrae TaxID=68223 RepID=A0A0F4IZD0_9ACTN|nr:glycosyltransferase family 2 protein [Streptomyces katrae]KJY27385.1 glycosyl transferase family 2 [Streptomyces katrae]